VPGEFLPSNYLPVGLFLIIAVGFGLVTFILGSLIRPRRVYKAKLLPYESGMDPFSDARIPFPMRYYVITMLFVLFDIEVAFLYPWAVVFDRIGLYGLIEMLLFIGILLVGFVYAWKKGALEWE
jgi:NADH-quinone oxidoreductase subunit A